MPTTIATKRATIALAEQFRRSTDRDQRIIFDALEHYTDQFRRADVEQHPDPGGKAAGTHDAMAEWIRRTVKGQPARRPVSCRRGCSHCCRLQVDVFPDEAALALIAADAAGLAVDRERLRRQADADTLEQWSALPSSDRACVFLTAAGECGIYEHRPAACRKYMVATAPELCDTDANPGASVGVVVSTMAEVIASAAFDAWGRSHMAPALLAALAAREDPPA